MEAEIILFSDISKYRENGLNYFIWINLKFINLSNPQTSFGFIFCEALEILYTLFTMLLHYLKF